MSAGTLSATPKHVDNVDEMLTTEIEIRKKKDPLYIFIFYWLSHGLSISGLSCAMWGYIIIITAPFVEDRREIQRDGYDTKMLGLNTVVGLLAANIMWTSFNLHLASKGRQNRIWLLNMMYDVFIFVLLIAFGVVNIARVLWDRTLCDGIQDQEVYKICGIAMFRLLIVELLAVNLGILIAILHIILLIARCCTQGWRNGADRSQKPRTGIREEESISLRLKEEKSKLLKQS